MTDSFGIPLVTEDLIDCFGQPTHRLVLEIDGTVTITFSLLLTVELSPMRSDVDAIWCDSDSIDHRGVDNMKMRAVLSQPTGGMIS